MAAASEEQLERELDRLYQLAPGDFTAARDELARRLRAEDRRDLAEQVKKLRKPTVAVWLVNRLAVEREVDVMRLVKIGEALASGQAALAGGDRSDEFVEARREEERALARLATAARELAEREGVGEAALPRATATLRAASLTEDGRELLKRGRLTEELEPPGFEALAGLTSAPARPKERSRRAQQQALEQARERARRAQAEERKLVAAAETARRKADEAAKRAAELRERAEEAEAAAAKATEEREAAESELDGRT